jgi:hypothetical protein
VKFLKMLQAGVRESGSCVMQVKCTASNGDSLTAVMKTGPGTVKEVRWHRIILDKRDILCWWAQVELLTHLRTVTGIPKIVCSGMLAPGAWFSSSVPYFIMTPEGSAVSFSWSALELLSIVREVAVTLGKVHEAGVRSSLRLSITNCAQTDSCPTGPAPRLEPKQYRGRG